MLRQPVDVRLVGMPRSDESGPQESCFLLPVEDAHWEVNLGEGSSKVLEVQLEKILCWRLVMRKSPDVHGQLYTN